MKNEDENSSKGKEPTMRQKYSRVLALGVAAIASVGACRLRQQR